MRLCYREKQYIPNGMSIQNRIVVLPSFIPSTSYVCNSTVVLLKLTPLVVVGQTVSVVIVSPSHCQPINTHSVNSNIPNMVLLYKHICGG